MDISKILDVLGDVVGAFNPVIGKGVDALSAIAAALGHLDDDKLQNAAGLGYIASELRNMADTEDIDPKKLSDLADMVDAVSLILEKNYLLVK